MEAASSLFRLGSGTTQDRREEITASGHNGPLEVLSAEQPKEDHDHAEHERRTGDVTVLHVLGPGFGEAQGAKEDVDPVDAGVEVRRGLEAAVLCVFFERGRE